MVGYLISAAVYGLLFAACVTVWRQRLTGSALAAAVGTQLIWSVILAGEAARAPMGLEISFAVEYLRALVWALVLARCLRRSGEQRTIVAAERAVAALAFLVVAGTAMSLFHGPLTPSDRLLERYGIWGAFALSIGGLVLVEQVARNTRPEQRWSLKYLWLGIGALYTWDLCMFAIAMLRGSAGEDFWVARGFVNALVGVLLFVALRRIRDWQSAAFLSPRIVFFNATLLAASLYVLAMAVGSYWIRRVGGNWGGPGQYLFLAAGALVLVVAVLSGQFRAWSRVTIAKYLFPYRYDYRSEWQKLTRALSEGGEVPLYDRIARVMAGFVNSANGGLWLRDAEGAYAPAGGELAPAAAPHEAGSRQFFEHLLQNEWICNLDEVRNPQPGAADTVEPPEWMRFNNRLWLVVPLICENVLVGFVVIGEPLATIQLSWEEIDLLKSAGRQVASFLAFEQAAKRLAEAHQFEAVNRLSAVLMHDLRHLIAQQALVVQNAARHRGNPEFFDDAILTIDNSVKRMTRLMEELRGGVLTEQAHRVELAELCAEAVKRCAERNPVPALEVHARTVEVVVSRERLLHTLEHVIRNGQDATQDHGIVTVRLRAAGQRATIEIADTGVGMDAEFIRHRLFRPFDTTKGERGFGIGAYEACEFVRKCGGSVEVESVPGQGTTFILHLPLAPALAPGEAGTAHELQRAH